MNFDPTEHPHRRYNPLLGEYVLVSPHRMKRPWQGQEETPPREERPSHDPDCYLCPGNTRKSGATNPDYDETFVFTNDYEALLHDTPAAPDSAHPLFRSESIAGTCRVICFSPRHDLTLAQMSPQAIERVVRLWMSQAAELGEMYQWVQIFENRGSMMGSSNPHPHGQIWAHNTLPNLVVREDNQQHEYYQQHGTPLLLDYAAQENQRRERIIAENDTWLAVVPYWATWPFETLVLPKAHTLRLPELDAAQQRGLADVLKQMLVKFDNLFEVSFPYSMGWHGAPFNAADNTHWQLHAHFYPPLLRSATVRKFMVGYEMLAQPQRDLTAEQAAARLRELPNVHYLEQE